MVLQSHSISILFSAAAEIQQRQNFKASTRQLTLERWRGGVSMALTFYFSGNRRIQPWSFQGGVCAFNPCLCVDASTKILQLRILLTKCPHTHTRKPACRCNY